MSTLAGIAPGLLLCFLIAMPAWLLGNALPLIGSPVFGILFGMIIIMIFPRLKTLKLGKDPKTSAFSFEKGINYAAKKILQYAIILLGFGMNLFQIFKVGGQSLFIIIFTLTASFLTAFVISKAIKLEGKKAVLIGVGTSICGGSAIAATAPVIKAEDHEVAHAISTIFLFNIIAVFIFPPLGHLLGLSDMGFGMWAGTAINDTSSVVAAGTAWSNAAGNNTALAFATIVKLTRTLMIVPITLVLAIYTVGKSKVESKYSESKQSDFNFVRIFPWFVLGFVATAVISTFASMPDQIAQGFVTIGKYMIVMAMSAIGLNTHLKKLITNGFKPIFLGLCCWFAVAFVSLVVQSFLHIW